MKSQSSIQKLQGTRHSVANARSRKRWLAVSGLSLLLGAATGCRMPLFSDAAKAGSSLKDTITVTPQDRQPTLGAGYDSWTQISKDSVPCVSGKFSKFTTGSSNVTLSQSSQGNSVMRELTGEVKGTPRVLFLQPNLALGFFRSTETSKSTMELVYTAKILQESEKIEQVSLAPEVSQLTANQLLARCGDEYIGQINRGGLLSISLKLDFGSEVQRQKWQGILKFSTPLQEIGKDLKRKSEQNELQGLLTVQVHQVGGSPSQALTSAKTCSMSNAAELSQCSKVIEELIQYSTNSFPAQVAANPAILQYHTVPLVTLGLTGASSLPPLDSRVLQIRKELEQRLGFYSEALAKLQLAQTKGLEKDQGLENALDTNLSFIRVTAKTCYQYRMTDSGPSWDDCFSSYKNLASQLRPIEGAAATVQQLEVDAQEPLGRAIFNDSNAKMTVVYAVDPMSRWNFGVKGDVGLQSSAACNHSCASSSHQKGALLVQSASGTERVRSVQGTLEIYPGEAAYFFMNDEKNRYSDNRGSMTVLWRCIDCKDQNPKRPLSKVIVNAQDSDGIPVTHRGGTQATYVFSAYGQWSNAVGKYAWTDGRGSSESCGSSCPLPSGNNQLLVGKKSDGTTIAIGIRQQVRLAPGEAITLQANDDAGGYRDNGGELVVYYQCVDCP